MKDTHEKAMTKHQKRQAEQIQTMSEHLASQDAEQVRTEAIQTARAVALSVLPKRRSEQRDSTKTLRLGSNFWLRVIYSTGPNGVLPYGEDRFVLAGIQSLALEQNSPVVLFEEVSELLKTFGLSTDGRSIERLRERFKRISDLAIRLIFASNEQDLNDASKGEQSFVIQRYSLPTREEVRCAKIGEKQIPRLFEDGTNQVHFGVVLSSYFWEHLKEPKNRLILPLDLMKLFVNNPTGWDYASFLVYRCSRAQSASVIDHDVLMSLFKDNPDEEDKKTIKRLLNCHDLVMTALNGRLNASLEQTGHFQSTGGRPKERWILKIGPSHKVVWSGKKSDSLHDSAEIPTDGN